MAGRSAAWTNIPEQIRTRPQWVLWKREKRYDKLTKVLYNARTGKRAKSNDPTTWSEFSDAVSGLTVFPEFDGIGFVLSATDPFVGVDLDDCIDKAGELAPWARNYVGLLDTYTERSQSKKGVHALAMGKLPPGRRKKGSVEMYCDGRYFVVTGDHLEGTPPDIQDRAEPLLQMHARVFGAAGSAAAKASTNGRHEPAVLDLDDQQLLEKARSATNGSLFRSLYDHGDGSRYGGDDSAADMALCDLLAFWCQRDAARMDRLFQGSALYRAEGRAKKWHSQRGAGSYGSVTIGKAIQGCHDCYQPRQGTSARVGTAAEQWEDPIPLEAVDLPAFPVDALEPWMKDMVEAMAEAMQVPPDLPALLSLPILSTAFQRRFEAAVREGWNEPLSIYACGTAPSGERKTPVYTALVAPLNEYEQDLGRLMGPEIVAAQSEYDVLSSAVERLKKQAARADDDAERRLLIGQVTDLAQKLEALPLPAAPRLIADDTTSEGLGMLLARQGGRMAIMSDEGDIFDMMAGRYQNGDPNIGLYLRGHSGSDVRVDRAHRPSIYISRAAISIGVTVQPEVLLGMTANQTFRGRGLLARFIYALPKSKIGERMSRPKPVPLRVLETYSARTKDCLEIPAGTDAQGRPVPHRLEFTAAADDAVAEFEDWLEPQLKPGELGTMEGWASKLAGQMVRIAAGQHLASLHGIKERWKIPVDAEVVTRAVQVAKYLIPHAQAAFLVMGADPAVRGARTLLGWIRKHDAREFSKDEAFNGLRSQFAQAADLDEPLLILLGHRYIRQKEPLPKQGPGRPPSPRFLAHPSLWVE